MAEKKLNPAVVSLDAAAKARKRDEAPTGRTGTNFSARAERNEFFIPVSGFIWLFPEEMAVVNHPAFQRLGRINQLGQANIVFRGATHKRIEHVLGAVHMAQRMITAVGHNQAKTFSRGEYSCAEIDEPEARFIRLAALLHDIGHLAAGHTIEDELGLVGAHDEDKRLDLIFGMKASEFGGETDVTLGQVVDDVYGHAVPAQLRSQGLAASTIVRLLIRKKPKSGVDRYAAQEDQLKESADIRINVCRNMVANTICADLLDYLYRDWYHVGKPRTFEDRILQYMEIRNPSSSIDRTPHQEERKRRHSSDQLVVSLGASPKIRSDGVSAILSLLEWRYELAETVLFHRVKCIAAAMLDRALFELWENEVEEKIVATILHLSDDQLLEDCERLANQELTQRQGVTEERKIALGVAARNLKKIKNRELHKSLWAKTVDQLAPGQLEPLKRLYGGEGATNLDAAKNRAAVVRMLERDFCLRPGSLSMYCAEAKAKIAEVAIAVEQEIEPFHEHERKHDDRLSGGHLKAQIERFKRLWKLQIFMDSSAKGDLQQRRLLHLLMNAIDAVVNPEGTQQARIERVRGIALRLVEESDMEYYGLQVQQHPIMAQTAGSYPSGVPAIRSFFASLEDSKKTG